MKIKHWLYFHIKILQDLSKETLEDTKKIKKRCDCINKAWELPSRKYTVRSYYKRRQQEL